MSKNKSKSIKALIFLLAVILLAMFSLSCEKPQILPPPKETLFEQILPGVCTVEADTSFGSGFVFNVFDGNVYIITNKHVVSEVDSVKLKFDNRPTLTGTVIGYNSYHDIAVVLIKAVPNPTEFVPLTFLSSDETVKMGQDAYLIGNALNHGLSSFSGIVSKPVQTLLYTDSISQKTKNVPVIAVTTPVNSGSSGCPVFDKWGRVLGIGTYQINQSGNRDVEGMSFAVPSQIAKNIAEQIIEENGKAEKPPKESLDFDVVLRISGEDKDAYYIDFEALNFFSTFKEGKLTVTQSSEIAMSFGEGLKAGDEIIAIGNLNIQNAALFDIFYCLQRYTDSRLMSNVKTDKPLTVQFLRDGQNKQSGFFSKYEKNY